MKKYLHYFVILALCLPHYIYAQDLETDSIRLNELLVTGSKLELSRKLTPLSVSQISKQDIANSGKQNILPALNAFSPGIFVTERNILGFGVSSGGAGSISMRGISSSPNNQVLVMIDGRPEYQGIFGHPLADSYLSANVEKVEIIRGPASILYGSNAMAGAINIITKEQDQEGLKLHANVNYGSYNTLSYGGGIGYKKEKFSILASGNHRQTEGYRPNTPFSISNGYSKLGYEFSKHLKISLDFNVSKYTGKDTVYSSPTTPASKFEIDVLRANYAASLENKFDKIAGAVKVFKNVGDHRLSDGFRSHDFISDVILYQTLKLFKGNLITLGTDLKQYGGTANSGMHKDSLISIEEWAGYAYVQQNLFFALTLSGGLRMENNSKYGSELLPMGGISYRVNSKNTLKTSISKGFRSPTIMEMYLYAPNPDLEPERMMNYEISWLQSLANDKLQLELTLYKVKGDNMIQVVGFGPTAKRQNIGSFDNQGIEFSGKYSLTNNLFLSANYSYLDLEKAVLAAPRQQVNISANYKYKIWNVNLTAQYIERLYTSIIPTKTVEADYLLVNSRISARPMPQLEVFMTANNLLNQRYEINKGYEMPGINFNVGMNLQL